MSSSIVIAQPSTDAIAERNGALVAGAHAVIVTNLEENESALGILQDLSRAEKAVSDLFAEPKRQAHAAHKSICAAEAKLLDPIQQAKRIVNGKVTTYELAERKRADEERMAREEQARREEEERKILEAVAAEEAGDAQLAEAIIEEAVETPIVHVKAAIAKVSGVSSQERWSAQIVDVWALIQWVAADKSRLCYLEPDQLAKSHPSLNRLAVSARRGFAVPGVRAVTETIRSVRSA